MSFPFADSAVTSAPTYEGIINTTNCPLWCGCAHPNVVLALPELDVLLHFIKALLHWAYCLVNSELEILYHIFSAANYKVSNTLFNISHIYLIGFQLRKPHFGRPSDILYLIRIHRIRGGVVPKY
uniref:Uncharacterized protein n=1 Tax=Arundo donax TaxID=35708 RepID=A0A0A9DHM2_ARUDO